MTKTEVLEFIRNNPVFALATMEDDRAHVRMMTLYRADETGIILFNAGESKDLHKQLMSRPDVEMCFYNPQDNIQIRITGVAEVLEEQRLKEQVVLDFPFLKKWVDNAGYDALVVYCLKGGKASIWTMETNYKPKEYIQL